MCEAGCKGGDTREEEPGVAKEEVLRGVCLDTRDAREMELVGEEGGDPGANGSISNKRKKRKK